MEDLTFGEQVKIVLGRKGMTIKELAEMIEAETGKKMSRQNLTQRLGRDNFQEQDMRLIARILGCPFHLSIMSGEAAAAATRERGEKSAAAERPMQKTAGTIQAAGAAQGREALKAETPERTESGSTESQKNASGTALSPDERDMTIGELYEIHQELSELEENIKAGEPAESVREELERPKRDWFRTTGSFFLRKKHGETADTHGTVEEKADPGSEEDRETAPETLHTAERRTVSEGTRRAGGDPGDTERGAAEPEADLNKGSSDVSEHTLEQRADAAKRESEAVWQTEEARQAEDTRLTREEHLSFHQDKPEDFEPVISHDDAEEDRVTGDVNPYTGKEYQSNSVRMHPTRIGYVQVYDRKIHKWTDMTEWAFLGYQERKKALLGKAYEPPIYLD